MTEILNKANLFQTLNDYYGIVIIDNDINTFEELESYLEVHLFIKKGYNSLQSNIYPRVLYMYIYGKVKQYKISGSEYNNEQLINTHDRKKTKNIYSYFEDTKKNKLYVYDGNSVKIPMKNDEPMTKVELSYNHVMQFCETKDELKSVFDTYYDKYRTVGKYSDGLIDYSHYQNPNLLGDNFFNMYYKNSKFNRKIDKIDELESRILYEGYRGACIYINPNKYDAIDASENRIRKGDGWLIAPKDNVYEYDVNSFYPYILSNSDFKISLNKPECIYLTDDEFEEQINNDVYGLFYVHLSMEDVDKLRKNMINATKGTKEKTWLTHIEVIEYRKYVPIHIVIKRDVSFNLEINAMIYDSEKLMNASTIFKEPIEKLYDIRMAMKKDNCPYEEDMKNILNQSIGAMATHGYKEIDFNDKYDPLHWSKYIYDDDGEIIGHSVLDEKQIFKFDMARIIPFMNAYGRMNIRECANHLKSVEATILYIHTDGIICNYEPKNKNRQQLATMNKILNSSHKSLGKFKLELNNVSNVYIMSVKNKYIIVDGKEIKLKDYKQSLKK